MMKEDYGFNNYEALKEIIKVMAYQNFYLSRQVAFLAIKGLNLASDSESIGYLECLRGLLHIQDNLHA